MSGVKTTLDIPDALACQAMDLAARDGDTLCDLVLAGLRSEIARRAASPNGFRAGVPGEGRAADLSLADAPPSSYQLPD